MTTTKGDAAAPPAAPTRPPPRNRSDPTSRRRLPFSPWHLLLAPLAVLFAFPFVQMIMVSFMPREDINRLPPRFVPTSVTLDGYQGLLDRSDVLIWLANTTIVATIAVASNVVLCSLAGYGFARLRFRGRDMSFLAILGTIMIPIQLLMIPTYVMFSRLHLLNSLAALVIPWLATAFGVFLMRQLFLSVPRELEEAGLLDGASRLQIFWRIVLPLARPSLMTLAVFTLVGSWNDLIWPVIAISDSHLFTLQIGLANFQGVRRTEWSLLMAGNVVAVLPLLVGFLVAQKHFLATMANTGMKG
jgi:multiple sugar transport system permease protein